MQTVEATIDENGAVQLVNPIRLATRHRAFLTILDETAIPEEDLAPETTRAEMAASHRARETRFARGDREYVSIDLPFIDDGADW